MSALTDLFSSMANKIRSKTGTATTYTPPQMVSDGIDDVFDAGVASATTSITPSDSSPVAMSANTGYKPTTAGYAIASNPTSLAPSNSSPVTISSGTIYKAGGNGKAVASVTSKTPSDTSPASVTSGSIIKPSSAGYLVKTVSNLGGAPDRTFTNDSAPSSGAVDISVTQKPRYIILGVWSRATAYTGMVGIIDVTKSQAYRMGYFSSAVSETWSNYTSYFPTISSSIVTYSYSGFLANSRVKILMYY